MTKFSLNIRGLKNK